MNARPAPAAPAARAARARHDRRGRRRAAVHAVGRLPAARGARARGGRAAARAGRPRRPADRRRARARRATPRRCSSAPSSPQAELAAAAGSVAGRGADRRVPVGRRSALAVPAMQALAREAPGLRCELVEAEPEQSLPALALGDVDLVLGRRVAAPAARAARRASTAQDLHRDPVRSCCPPRTRPRAATPARCRSPSSPARRGPPATRARGWEEMIDADLPRARRLRPRHPPPRRTTASRARARRRPGTRSRSSRGSSPPARAGRRGARDRRGLRAPHDLRRDARGRRAAARPSWRPARGDRRGAAALGWSVSRRRRADTSRSATGRAHVEHGAALARGGDEPGVAQRGEVLRDPARAAAEAAGELRGRGAAPRARPAAPPGARPSTAASASGAGVAALPQQGDAARGVDQRRLPRRRGDRERAPDERRRARAAGPGRGARPSRSRRVSISQRVARPAHARRAGRRTAGSAPPSVSRPARWVRSAPSSARIRGQCGASVASQYVAQRRGELLERARRAGRAAARAPRGGAPAAEQDRAPRGGPAPATSRGSAELVLERGHRSAAAAA